MIKTHIAKSRCSSLLIVSIAKPIKIKYTTTLWGYEQGKSQLRAI